jgi:hypothetical protein
MPIWKLQCSFQVDSALPRDAVVITPHFNDHGALTDPANLCNDLAVALGGWMTPANGAQITVKAYDAQGSVPVYPAASVVKNVGTTASSGYAREVALCLSYYADFNRPRSRGRLYLPPGLMLTPPNSLDLRPNATWRNKAMALGPLLAGLGGIDVDWVVWSRKDHVARKVTNYYCDDEWDVVRSRGLRATTRTAATTSG